MMEVRNIGYEKNDANRKLSMSTESRSASAYWYFDEFIREGYNNMR
jgi:hypothetical protein